jgi:methoxymalonate biosynthesis acyl carrier protein
MEQSKEQLREFLARHIGGRNIGDDEQIFATGFVNSMFAMQLVLFLEKNFKIDIANEDLDLKNFQTINAMADLIGRKTQAETATENATVIA